MDQVAIFKALSNQNRLKILNWLKDPEINFKAQKSADYKHGVSVGQIQQKAGLAPSTVSEYLTILFRAGLLRSIRIGQLTYYSRDNQAIANLGKLVKSKI